jgi:putative transcriptional regulator
MNGIKHHISDDLLMGYAAGALPQAFDLVVATHVSLSDDARARLAGFEELGGVVLSDMEEAELAEDSLEQTLARIAGTPVREKPEAPSNGVFPAPCARSWAAARPP